MTVTEARDGALTAAERLRFHREHSGPVMEKLHGWLESQFAERKTEPNSHRRRRNNKRYTRIGGECAAATARVYCDGGVNWWNVVLRIATRRVA